MNSRIKPWQTTYSRYMTVRNTRTSSSNLPPPQCSYECSIIERLFTFFAALHRYKFQSSIGAYEDKTATLSDADTVWTEVRHMHMREAIDKLMADFNKFVSENAGFKG